MLSWLKRKLFGCPHSWETIETGTFIDNKKGYAVGKVYVMRCVRCGAMMDFKTRVTHGD